MRRFALVLVACAVAGLAAATPVAGKEGMTATLLTRVPLGAMPGTTLRVAWKVNSSGANAARGCNVDHRFYVRLKSASFNRSTRGWGRVCGRHYVAKVRVPRGGIGDIQILLVGMRYVTGQPPQRADMNIPITNDPLPGGAMGSRR